LCSAEAAEQSYQNADADLKESREELAKTKRFLASSEMAKQVEADEHGMTRTAKETALHELTEWLHGPWA